MSRCWLCFVGFLLGSLLAFGDDGASAQELPRYRLQPGQELVYRSEYPLLRDGKLESKYVLDWKLHVIRAIDGGGWRIVFREQRTSFAMDGGSETAQQTGSVEGHFDLSPDGRWSNLQLPLSADPMMLFPPLPPDAAALARGWSARLAWDETMRNCRVPDVVNMPAGEWHFLEEPRTALDAIYEMKTRRNYAFDVERGLISRATTVMELPIEQTGSLDLSQPQELELVSVDQMAERDLAALAEETDRYFAVVDAYEKTSERVGHLPGQVAALDTAFEPLRSLPFTFRLPLVRAMAEKKLEDYQKTRTFMLESTARFEEVLDRPSPDWETTDMDGQPRRLADYRGQVVVLDFWYRSCAWCGRALPQVVALSHEFKGESVAFLGMSADRKAEDARFMIDHFKIGFSTLQNGAQRDGINQKYNINTWPTLIVLDRLGVVRMIHVGYSPNLREEVGQKIRQLLAE